LNTLSAEKSARNARVSSSATTLQTDSFNRVQVIPLTTNLDRVYPSEAVVELNGKQNKAMADQLTTVSKTRLLNLMGSLSPIDMRKIENVIKVQLAIIP
jgi:mRNA interferase MazF